MSKKITDNQLLGEIGETAARLRFLKIGFQFDVRSRLEAGVDAIVEVMDKGVPLAKMIAVQVKARHGNAYPSEDDDGFTVIDGSPYDDYDDAAVLDDDIDDPNVEPSFVGDNDDDDDEEDELFTEGKAR